MEPRSLTEQLLDQFDWHWSNVARPRLDDLTDAEYLWEPVSDCWSIRSRSTATTSHAAGAGDLVMDRVWPDPDPAPITTIAWRLGHIAIEVFGERAANHFGDRDVRPETTTWSATAAGGLALVDEHYGRWRDGVRELDDDGLAQPVGPDEGPFAESPYSDLVLHLNREALHHVAEVLLLRDLYRAGLGR